MELGAIQDGCTGSPTLPTGGWRASERCVVVHGSRCAFRGCSCCGVKLCLAVSPSTMFCPQAHGLVLKEALRSAWLQWARHGGLTTCPLTWHLKFPGLECIGLVLKKALWLHGQVSVAD